MTGGRQGAVSNTDSFIDEVTEEVRRDRLYAALRKYGWIGVLAVLLLVGGAAFREWQSARATAAAQAFGDAILTALEADAPEARITALQGVATDNPESRAILQMLIAAEQSTAGDDAAATQTLREVAANGDVPEIYRQIANLKALSRAGDTMGADAKRLELEALAVPGSPLRLLAEEQLALLELEAGDGAAAQERLQRILADAEVTAGLRRRVSQLIVALGGSLDAI